MVRSLLWSSTVPLSPVYGECSSRLTEGVCHFGNPPREPGCWAFYGLFTVAPRPPRNESCFVARRSQLYQTRRSFVRMRERPPPIHFCPFWNSLTLEKKQPQPPGTPLTSRGRLTGAVARHIEERCLPSRERCPICVPGRRVCKDHYLLSFLWEMSGNGLFPWRPEGSSVEVTLLHNNLLA